MMSLDDKRPSRRTFLLGLGIGGIAAMGWGAGQAWLPAAGLHRAEQRGFALGAEVSILVLHEHPDQARRAIAAAFDALKGIEQRRYSLVKAGTKKILLRGECPVCPVGCTMETAVSLVGTGG